MSATAASKVVLVTGAAGGIGGATCECFLAGGWRVAAVDVRPVAAAPDVLPITADLRIVAECRSAVAQAAAWAGRLDAVVNAAGVWTEGPSADTDEADWDRVLGVNLKGLYFVTSAAIPHLAATEGCVVNLSSDAGIQGNAGAAVYCASKGGVSILTKALALELAPQGIRVNAVCPGPTKTGMTEPMRARESVDETMRMVVPMARWGESSELAAAVAFLLSPDASFITGVALPVDGGVMATTGQFPTYAARAKH